MHQPNIKEARSIKIFTPSQNEFNNYANAINWEYTPVLKRFLLLQGVTLSSFFDKQMLRRLQSISVTVFIVQERSVQVWKWQDSKHTWSLTPNSSVSVGTRLWDGWQGNIQWRQRFLLSPPHPGQLYGRPHSPTQRVLGVNWTGCEVGRHLNVVLKTEERLKI
jgi:hypothetical protein